MLATIMTVDLLNFADFPQVSSRGFVHGRCCYTYLACKYIIDEFRCPITPLKYADIILQGESVLMYVPQAFDGIMRFDIRISKEFGTVRCNDMPEKKISLKNHRNPYAVIDYIRSSIDGLLLSFKVDRLTSTATFLLTDDVCRSTISSLMPGSTCYVHIEDFYVDELGLLDRFLSSIEKCLDTDPETCNKLIGKINDVYLKRVCGKEVF